MKEDPMKEDLWKHPTLGGFQIFLEFVNPEFYFFQLIVFGIIQYIIFVNSVSTKTSRSIPPHVFK